MIEREKKQRKSIAYDGDDELANTHTSSTDDEETPTADLIDKR